MDVYPWLKTLHVVLAIVAVGANLTYGVWQSRAARQPEHTGYALRGVKFLDDRIANPAYVALAVVGIAMILIGPYDFEHVWVAVSIGLYVVLAVVGLFVYSPLLRRQIAEYEASGAATEAFASMTARSRMLGALMGVVVLAIVVLMVVKPGV